MKVLKRVELSDGVEFDLRLPTERDVSFITNSWLKEFRTSKSTTGLSDGKYYYTQEPLIQKLLRKDSSMVLVACSTEQPDVIYGYIVADRKHPTLHWVHVKNRFRGYGIGSTLTQVFLDATNAATPKFSHHTRHFEHLAKLAEWSYKPFRWIEVNEQDKQPQA